MKQHRRYGLHLLLRYHGAVVEDRLQRTGNPVVRLEGLDAAVSLPPREDGEPHPTLTWLDRSSVRINDGSGRTVTPDSAVTVHSGPVELELRLAPQYRLERMLHTDLMMVAVLALMLAVPPLAQWLQSQTPPSGQGFAPEPTPELIARLLKEDYAGEDEGFLYEEKPRPVSEFEIEDAFLPAGDEGPLDEIGGARKVKPKKLAEPADEQDTKHQPLPEAPEVPELASEDGADISAPSGVPEPKQLQGEDVLDGSKLSRDEDQETGHDKEGWGIKDWNGAEDSRKKEELQVEKEIRIAKAMLEIDPDDPWALQQLSYYQYLAHQFDDAERTYNRFIELYPDSAAGYNNLALVYKRRGQYSREEGYYRLALALEPSDTHALNNLAICLAHQERYREALDIMEQVALLEPDEPYSDLHRAKIYAGMGQELKAFSFLEKALGGMRALDTLHSIEFRQDIRIDPLFNQIRPEPRFTAILVEYYGEEGLSLVGSAAKQGGPVDG